MRSRDSNAVQAPVQAYAGGRHSAPLNLGSITYRGTMKLLYFLAALPNLLYAAGAAFVLYIVISHPGPDGVSIEAIFYAAIAALFMLFFALNFYTLCADDPGLVWTSTAAAMGVLWLGILLWFFWEEYPSSATLILLLLLGPQVVALGRQVALLVALPYGPMDEIRAYIKEAARESWRG